MRVRAHGLSEAVRVRYLHVCTVCVCAYSVCWRMQFTSSSFCVRPRVCACFCVYTHGTVETKGPARTPFGGTHPCRTMKRHGHEKHARSREFEFKLSWSCPDSCPSRRNRTVTRRPSAQKPILLLSVDPRRRLGQTPQRTPAFLRHGACFGGSSLSRASKPMRGPCV